MPNRKSDDELLASALGRSNGCLSVEELEAVLNEGASVRTLGHLKECTQCQMELELLRSFASGDIAEHERAPIQLISARLKARSLKIAPARRAAPETPLWWRRIFAVSWFAPAAGAFAALLIVAGIALEWRRNRQPPLEVPRSNLEILRSTAIVIQTPVGDVSETPAAIGWQAVENAARYQINLMEVDQTRLWTGESDTARISLPADVRARIFPAKTLLIRITAFNAAGAKIGESEPMRFRVLQKVYTH